MRVLRWFWGIVTILSVMWMVYGLFASSSAYTNTIEQNETESEAYEAGAAIGASIGLGFFFCSGLPFFLLGSILYWRNGVALQRKSEAQETERRHQEQLAMMQAQIDGKRKVGE